MHEIIKNKSTGEHAAIPTVVSRTLTCTPHANVQLLPKFLTVEPIKLEGGEGGNETGDLRWQAQ